MRIVRRVFLVPLADNDHGKTTMIRAFVSQACGRGLEKQRKGVRALTSPKGREIDSYVFGRSYQEVEKPKHKHVLVALDANDSDWRTRELIVMPSHISGIDDGSYGADDLDQMIEQGHGAGFDVICASVIFTGSGAEEGLRFAEIWKKGWDEPWTVPNPFNPNPAGQLEAIGHDLWLWTSQALAP